MKRRSPLNYPIFFAFFAILPMSCSNEMMENVTKVSEAVLGAGTAVGQEGNLSTLDVVKGLKSALAVGSSNAAKELNVDGAYFQNQLIKIAFPPEAQQIASTLNGVGLGHLVTKATKSLNQAAEHAAIKSKPIFVSAIKQMTIQDAWGILKGPENSATEYLKRSTSSELTKAFRPVISSSLSQVNATKYWGDVIQAYNQVPFINKKINPDLTGYVTEKALYGLFVTVADEEKGIRKDPAKRVTSILRKVFGNTGQ